jgi:metallophosphoesterase (TIGR00282 family)
MMRILFFGDVFGKPGRMVVQRFLPLLQEEFKPDFCIANGENLAQGRGLTEKTAGALFQAGIAAFTSGNHLWDKRESLEYIKLDGRILKPLNYPEKAVGARYIILHTTDGAKLAVLTLIGQAFMPPANSPIDALMAILPEIQQHTSTILVDFHAEATAEKRTLGMLFDGQISALVGTHTHIQTADEEILPKGTAYLTDVGMTGPHDSVIGVKTEIILQKMTTGMPIRYEVADGGLQINAVVIDIDEQSGTALAIKRIKREVSWEND